ncbi:MAG: 50S ribosomal protein L30 [Candidatus Aminicenantes bacterium]|nr:50S ribosomal protein L30 [Candidatus Aminicenantes bacterium]
MTDKETKPNKSPKKSAAAAGPDRFLKITLVRSLIGYAKDQRETAKGLGLRKLQSSVVRRESPEVLGMVRKISHVLKVEAVEKP